MFYQEKSNLDKAISDYSKAIRINPYIVAAYASGGYAYFKKGTFDETISDYNRAIQRNTRIDEPYYSVFNIVILKNFYFADLYYLRAQAYMRKKEYEKTWENVHKIESMGGKVPLSSDCGFVVNINGKVQTVGQAKIPRRFKLITENTSCYLKNYSTSFSG